MFLSNGYAIIKIVIWLWFISGLLIGTFLNLCADHLPERRSVLNPPCCPYCQQRRDPREWISVLSYLLWRGRCQYCTAPLSLRRPVVELTTALLLAYLWQRYGFSWQLLFIAFYVCFLLLVLVIDLEHRLILNVVILPAIIIALLASLVLPHPGLGRALLGGFVGFALFYLAALAYERGMGAGDVKLAAFIGLITGFPQVIVALTIAILLGGFGAAFLLLTRLKGRKSYIPYGPFLAIGGMIALLYGQRITEWYTRFL